MAKIAVPDPPWAEIPNTEVDGAALGEVLRCDERTVRKYAQMGIAKRTARDRYALFQSIGGVVEHFRQMAAGHGTADAMRANVLLKDAQRRLVDLRYQQLDAQLISIPDIEMLWGDLVRSAKWLFLSLPERAGFDLPHLTADDQIALEKLCQTMLRELVLQGDPPLPASKSEAADDAD